MARGRGDSPLRRGVLRLVIIAAAVGVGVLVLANGQFASTSLVLPTPGATRTATPTPTVTKSVTPSPKQTTPQCRREGVTVQVYNASNTTGLAGVTQDFLIAQGYVAPHEPANAPSTAANTILYFRSQEDRVEAGCLQRDFFQTALVRKLPPGSGVKKDVQVAIYVGTDYAATHPVTD